MSLDQIKIPENIVNVEATHDKQQYSEIFLFTISTCMWCKKAKRWLNRQGFQYSYLDIDLIPVEDKNKLKAEIQEVFGVKPRFPFLVVNKIQWDSGYNPDIWEEMIN
ncbi:MAG: glutaredoxin family protein [Candidatus Heimdallarchaeota archaeon]|nr:MAG: glutaredoxin family protein [Candidatus Heimdallarchaeota archaeon]